MFVTGRSASPPADSDFWYSPIWPRSASGVMVTPASAQRLTAVYACVKLLGETIGMLPCKLYRRLPNGGKELATKHPLYRILHRAPNAWQSAMEWKEMMEQHLELRGNAYSEIIFDGVEISELVPLHPDLVHVVRSDLDHHGFVYKYRPPGAPERTILPGAMFHLRGPSEDGILGKNPIELERDALGFGLATQTYGSKFFKNDARPPAVIEWEGHFQDDEAARKFRASWQEAQSGDNYGKTAVLQRGMTLKEMGVKNTDSQFLDSQKYSDGQIARIFRVPPHKIGLLDRATFSNIEHQSIEFVTDTIHPRCARWEQALSRDLLLSEEADEYFFEFVLDGLMRGDAKARADYYKAALGTTQQPGWMSPNEVRALENLNPIEGLDQVQRPDPRMTPRGAPGQPPSDAGEDDDGRATALTRAAAERLARIEMQGVRRALSLPRDQFAEHIDGVYARHASAVARNLLVSSETATEYVRGCRERLADAAMAEDGGVEGALAVVLSDWESSKVSTLINLVEFGR